MGTKVILRLKDGRSLQLGRASDSTAAARVKADIERWLDAAVTLSVANAKGEIEDITPRSVISVETVIEVVSDRLRPPPGDSATG
jgi:hypothetical protein